MMSTEANAVQSKVTLKWDTCNIGKRLEFNMHACKERTHGPGPTRIHSMHPNRTKLRSQMVITLTERRLEKLYILALTPGLGESFLLDIKTSCLHNTLG